ncbi:hypothetical protein NHX12_007705, partial [Muraenolepis orangiensis]
MSSEERSATPVNKASSTPTHKSASSSSSSQRDSRQEADSWEIIEGLKIGQSNVLRPDKHEGFMLKKRKWPLKGWHKRFFVLDNGILKYSKSPIDVQRGKLHGSIDVGLSVMSIKKRARRIDLDTEEHIYHLKVKSQEIFDVWVSKLRHHRLYRQNEIVRSPRDATIRMFPPPPRPSSPPMVPAPVGEESPQPPPPVVHEVKAKPSTLPWQPVVPSSSSLPASYSNGQSKVAAWLQESEEMDKCSEELARCQSSLIELSKLLQSLEILQRTQSVPLSASMSPVRLHSSNPNLYAELLQEDFCNIAQKVHSLLKSAFNTVAIEKEKIKQVLSDQEQCSQSAQISTLTKSLSQALSQNAELRTRLSRIHSESVLSEQVVSVNIISTPDEASNESRLSMSESVSEFFDAQEVLLSASSSENEPADVSCWLPVDVCRLTSSLRRTAFCCPPEAAGSSLLSWATSVELVALLRETLQPGFSAGPEDGRGWDVANGDFVASAFRNGRRICLPAPSPDISNINLWNILRNNIGKDLSKVSMPVELNEPLNTLQHMCEELEYSELLDKAAETEDPFERM